MARGGYKLKEAAFVGEQGKIRKLSEVMRSRVEAEAVKSICEDVEDACPQLDHAIGHWAAMGFLQNYHRSRGKYLKNDRTRLGISKERCGRKRSQMQGAERA